MTKREKIIEILKSMSFSDNGNELLSEDYFPECVDAIVAIPIEVPKTKNINATCHKRYVNAYNPDKVATMAFIAGAEWAIDEILNRNK